MGVVEMACIYIILLFGKEKPTAMGALVGFFLLDGSGRGALGCRCDPNSSKFSIAYHGGLPIRFNLPNKAS